MFWFFGGAANERGLEIRLRTTVLGVWVSNRLVFDRTGMRWKVYRIEMILLLFLWGGLGLGLL